MKKILIIDDEEWLREMMLLALRQRGFDVVEAPNGATGIELARKELPDLILCDVNLETSTMGGFAFYERVREMDRLQETPFIFLSGLTDEALVRTGKELGVDDYLSKPISGETLIATIKGKLRRYSQLKKRMN